MTKSDKGNALPPLTSLDEEILRVIDQDLTVRRNGQPVTISARKAFIEKYFQTALGGSPQALHQLSRRIADAEIRQADQYNRDIAAGRAIKVNQTKKLDRLVSDLQAQGLAEAAISEQANDLVYHPDDIEITETGWRLNGPWDEESLASLHDNIELRDAFLLQWAYDDCCPITQEENAFASNLNAVLGDDDLPALTTERAALLFATMLNKNLPTRFQLNDLDFLNIARHNQRFTKRELAKLAYRNWQRLGVNTRRGWVTPPVSSAVRSLLMMNGIVDAFKQADGKGKRLSTHAIKQIASKYQERIGR